MGCDGKIWIDMVAVGLLGWDGIAGIFNILLFTVHSADAECLSHQNVPKILISAVSAYHARS
jgi:hypothetical protein